MQGGQGRGREEIARQKEKNLIDFYEVDGFESGDVRKFFL
jgi:hypothetical protein